MRTLRHARAATWMVGQEAASPSLSPEGVTPGGAETKVVFHSSDVEAKRPSDPPEVEREKDPAWRAAVPDDLLISHPLIRKAVAAIRQAARAAPKHGVAMAGSMSGEAREAGKGTSAPLRAATPMPWHWK